MPEFFADLVGIIDDGRIGDEIRPTLLDALADLFIQRRISSPDAVRHFVAITLALVGTVSPQARKAVAYKLGADPQTPREILERLADDLPTLDELYRDEAEIENPDADELNDIFFAANAAERRLILLTLGSGPNGDPAPAPAGTLERLENAALAHDVHGFARELERALGISPALARRIVADASGEPLVAALRDLACPPDVLHRVLLFLNGAIGQSVERVYALAKLYEEISPAAARELIGLWREAHPRTAPLIVQHQPLLWNDTHAEPRRQQHPARVLKRPAAEPIPFGRRRR